jgi:hypothetical protein
LNKEKNTVCIIGGGTYGSYLIKRLLQKFGQEIQIKVIEIGDENTKSEEEIGLISKSSKYKASKFGRYFGLGGTSARWGGQILFFDERDNLLQDKDWSEIIDVCKKYQEEVEFRLLGSKIPKKLLPQKGNIKTGIWLKYQKRNLFKKLTKQDKKQIEFFKNLRVIDFEVKNGIIKTVTCQTQNGELTKVQADRFYLTAGAIESCRLMLMLNEREGFQKDTDLGKNAGDHLSVELFKITEGKPIIDGQDLIPTFYNWNIITKRLIIYSEAGRIGYLHPIINKDIKVFSAIKQLLFGRQLYAFKFSELLDGLVFLIRFGLSVLFLKKMYLHKGDWGLQLDIEQATENSNSLVLNNQLKDKFAQVGIQINWNIEEKDLEVINEIKDKAAALLKSNNISFKDVYHSSNSIDKVEDVYHPTGFMRMGSDSRAVVNMDCQIKGFSNLYHFSTALFSSAKSINPTAPAFCLIEKHLENIL